MKTSNIMNDLYIRELRFDSERFAAASLPPQDEYLRSLDILSRLDTLELTAPITFLTGENGSGKSTLIEAIAVACGYNAEGGSRSYNFSTRQSSSSLYEYLTIVRSTRRPRDGYFLRAESFYNAASYLEELDAIPAAAPPVTDGYGGKPLHEMSHGESFLALMNHRFHGDGLYILDEPESALSAKSQLAAITLLSRLANEGSQFIISTHSPILLGCPNSQIYELRGGRLCPTPYRETASYRLTRQFLEDTDRMVKYLTE